MEDDEDFDGDALLDAKSDYYEAHKTMIDFYRSFYPKSRMTDIEIVEYTNSL